MADPAVTATSVDNGVRFEANTALLRRLHGGDHSLLVMLGSKLYAATMERGTFVIHGLTYESVEWLGSITLRKVDIDG